MTDKCICGSKLHATTDRVCSQASVQQDFCPVEVKPLTRCVLPTGHTGEHRHLLGESHV